MKRKEFERAVGDTTHAATDLGKDALAQASAYLQQAQEYLSPRAQDALNQAGDYIAPLARDARKKGAKLAADAMDAVQPKIDEALDKVTPTLENAYARFAPAVDDARSKVQDEFLPAISTLLHNAADDLAKVELPQVPAPAAKKKSAWATIGQVLLAGGLLVGVVVAIKRFLAPTDSGWQAHEPSQPYVPTPTQNLVDDLDQADDAVSEDAAEQWLDEGGEEPVEETVVVAEDAPVTDGVSEEDADPFVASPYGDGSYVGTEPPEGFTIKGNERSMKFHIKGNGGWERTIADVWFNSEEAASAAGFTKAQR